jgi:hypothetical protein
MKCNSPLIANVICAPAHREVLIHDAWKVAEPHRRARWSARSHAPQDVVDEPNRAGKGDRCYLPTSTEAREGNHPHWRKPIAADRRFLHVPISFFFEDPLKPGAQVDVRQAHSPGYMSDFLISADGLALSKSFMRIKYPKIRRRIIQLVEDIARNLD